MTILMLLFALTFHADPAPVPPTVDELLDKLAATQKQQTELAKTALELATEIQTRLVALTKRLADLGVNPPAPPTPPKPVDPLIADFRGLIAADGTPAAEKLVALADLLELYRQAAVLPSAKGPDGAYRFQTVGQVVSAVKAVADSFETLGPVRLKPIRVRVATELAAAFAADADLDDDSRAKLGAMYLRFNAALQAASK